MSAGYAVLYSFGLAGSLRSGFTISKWTETLSSQEVVTSFLFSLYIATCSMILAVAMAMLLICFLRREIRSRWFSTFNYFPLAIPAIVAAFCSFQLFSKAGLLSRLFYRSGWIATVQEFPDLIQDPFGIGIITTHVMMAFPFFAILFRNFSESENLDELVQLARTLGASSVQAEWKITVPILLRRALPTLVVYFIFVLGSYEIPLLLGRQAPQMVSVLIIRKLQRFNLMDMPTAYAVAFLYLFIVSLVILLLFRKRKLSYDL